MLHSNVRKALKSSPIVVVSHDAGGAAVVSAWVKRHSEYKYRFVLDGPALTIFRRTLGFIENVGHEKIERTIEDAQFVLTGTSWASDLEKEAITVAQHKGVKAIAFLDHWIRYRERFQWNGQIVFPDELWVGDDYAWDLALKSFPEIADRIRLVANPYFIETKKALVAHQRSNTRDEALRILYICEPLIEHSIKEYGHPNYWGYHEFHALTYFLQSLDPLKNRANVKVRIRLHPSEISSKYNYILDAFQTFPWSLSKSESLTTDVVWADWVVGQESMALVIGLLAEKKVFSCIPPGGRPSCLPYTEIDRLEDGLRYHTYKIDSPLE